MNLWSFLCPVFWARHLQLQNRGGDEWLAAGKKRDEFVTFCVGFSAPNCTNTNTLYSATPHNKTMMNSSAAVATTHSVFWASRKKSCCLQKRLLNFLGLILEKNSPILEEYIASWSLHWHCQFGNISVQLFGHLVGGELLLEEEEESVDCWPMFDDFKFADSRCGILSVGCLDDGDSSAGMKPFAC